MRSFSLGALALAITLLGWSDTAHACGQPPAQAGQPRGCPVGVLAGDWSTRDGVRIRITDSRDRGFTWIAKEVLPDGSAGVIVYSHLRLGANCSFRGRRHVDPNEVTLRRSPPHPVTLRIDLASGELLDADLGPARIFKRPPVATTGVNAE